jgi:leucyl aminopeptidase
MAELLAVQDGSAALGPGGDFDAVVVVAPALAAIDEPKLRAAIQPLAAIDAKLEDTLQLVAAPALAGSRLVLAPTGPLGRDHDDVRRFAEAAREGVKRARDAGARRPLVVVAGAPADADFAEAIPVSALGALSALWEPLEAREAQGGGEIEPVERVGIAALAASVNEQRVRWAGAVEQGRRLARDLCGTEPERMAPPRFAAHVKDVFLGSSVKVTVIDDQAVIARDYPLIAAVARASQPVERHQPRIVRLEYVGQGPIERSIWLAGKGVTYDTGGADLKTGGVMAGMSRDKGGAAAVAGFVLAAARLEPRGVRIVGELGVVRNSIGSDAYVSDEIITSHAGVRVRIGNTDAEGRLVLADLLSHLRGDALSAPAPLLLSIATLTGHANRAVGPYCIAIDNRWARIARVGAKFMTEGDRWGDPFEVSRLRREDWDFVKPRSKADDVLSCNNAPSSATERGHQFPMAFLAIASGLAPHCHRDSEQRLAYTHLDIAGAATERGDWQHGRPSGAPVVALCAALLEG